jgi:cytochrome c oxidase subunit 2
MGARSRIRLLSRLALVLLPVALLVVGCTTDNPQNALTDRGDVSARETLLYHIPFWIAVAVFILVEGLVIYVLIRYRPRRQDDSLPIQTHGHTRLELTWTIIPAVILGGLAIPTISGIVWLSKQPENPVQVRVIAHQWWWEFRYPNPTNPGQEVITANEMHIPVGRKVYATVEASDVIHSFWVPNLFGKQDAVPNHENHIWFNARAPGVYSGQCAEYCGESHALMRFLVIAEPESDYNAWLANLAKPPVTPTTPSAQRGEQVFMGNACIGCHAIEGTNAQGRVAPNLTHFGSRSTLGANRLANNPEDVFRWISNVQDFKPGAKMPTWHGVLSDEDIRSIVDYLESLK